MFAYFCIAAVRVYISSSFSLWLVFLSLGLLCARSAPYYFNVRSASLPTFDLYAQHCWTFSIYTRSWFFSAYYHESFSILIVLFPVRYLPAYIMFPLTDFWLICWICRKNECLPHFTRRRKLNYRHSSYVFGPSAQLEGTRVPKRCANSSWKFAWKWRK